MLEVQAIAVELPDSGRGDQDAGRIGDFKDVQSFHEGLAEGRYEAVVWGRGEG